ncbi:glycosyltransferase family 4 protein [Promicromonospora thailandica]|uniref:D-inositol 3-phosphate glycosyltransferase n=1 Tax=Promicromonospora thailandica TaxID=765201 RepID=A0A9X2G0N5_9MICO|nr:glycosyltransferase family 4 protein [Promicromonospora thailandica]MCP2264892.1 Glycosyltransferase involved in cell wall bisynthesis [Promicromonospora thailandica]
MAHNEHGRPARVAHVLLVAPACDGHDVGESWLAHQWAARLSERFHVTLLSTYKRGHVPPSRQLPRTRVVEWAEPPVVHRAERLNSLLQPAYAPFYVRARRYVRHRLTAGERFDVAHQVTPVALRYPSPLVGLGLPVVVGPVGGSLESPPAFAREEGGTPWYQRLRRLDRSRFRHDPLLRATFETADCVVGVAPYVREILGDLTLRRFEALGDVAVQEVRPAVDRSGRRDPVRLLFVGRLVRTKGAREAIRALSRLRDLPVHLDVVGDGNDRAACAELVHDLGLDDRVTLHGAVPRADVDRFYERADVFLFPSYREPGGAVVLEAMAYGLPLVVCDRGGPGANVSDACAVRLPVRSPDQLADDAAGAVRRLVADPGLRLRMGAAAREHVAAHHLWSRRVDRMADLYEQVAAERARTRTRAAG